MDLSHGTAYVMRFRNGGLLDSPREPGRNDECSRVFRSESAGTRVDTSHYDGVGVGSPIICIAFLGNGGLTSFSQLKK